MDQLQNVVIIDQLIVKEAQQQYEKIKARSQIDESMLKNVNFEQSVDLKKNNHRVLFPVIHKDCFFNLQQHICGCLAQVLSNREELTKCAQLSLTNLNNLQIAIIPYYALQSVHQKTDQVSIIQGFVLNKILRPPQYYYPLALEKPQMLFREMMRKKDDSNNFTNRIKLDERFNKAEGFEFYAACLLDWVKLYIPMRFKTCTHIECFDLTSIVFRLENEILQQKNVPELDRKYSKIICGFNVDGYFCPSQCVASYDNIIEQLVIDYELMDALRKSEQEAYKFIYIKQTKEILDEFTYSSKQLNQQPKQGNAKIKIKQIDSNPTSLKVGDYSVLQVMNLKNSKAVQKKAQFQKYQDIDISLICPLSKKYIQFPARCLKCPQQQCADLKSLLEYFNDRKTNQGNQQFECPLCKTKYEKRYSSIVPQNVFYFDEFIMGIIMQIGCKQDKFIQLKGSSILLNEFKKQRILKTEMIGIYPTGKIKYSNLICSLSSRLLEDPLIIKDCEKQLKISFQQFFNLYKQKNYFEFQPFIICDCKNCCLKNTFNLFEDLAYDEMLSEILSVYNQLNIKEREVINIQSEIIYNYNNKQLLCNVKYIEMDILGFVIKHYQNNDKKRSSINNLNILQQKFTKVAGKDQFKKWKLSIENLNFKINKIKIE